MSPPVKLGDCSVCKRHIEVTWHRDTGTWYCDEDWPRPNKQERQVQEAAREYNERWDALVKRHYGQPAALDQHTRRPATPSQDQLRVSAYGIHVDDSQTSPGDFRVLCPVCGLVDDFLPMLAARRRRAEHEDFHVPATVAEELIVSTDG